MSKGPIQAVGDFFDSLLLRELFKGMALTGRYLFSRKITIRYPEEKTPMSPRTRRQPGGATSVVTSNALVAAPEANIAVATRSPAPTLPQPAMPTPMSWTLTSPSASRNVAGPLVRSSPSRRVLVQ